MKKLALALGFLAIVGCSAPQPPMNGQPFGNKQIPVHVSIDTKGVALGAYQVVIQFDAGEAGIAEVHQSHRADFQWKGPNYDLATASKGQLRVTGYSLRTTPPSGPYHLLTVSFVQVGAYPSPVSVRVERLYDTQRPPREIQGDVLVDRTTLDFTKK